MATYHGLYMGTTPACQALSGLSSTGARVLGELGSEKLLHVRQRSTDPGSQHKNGCGKGAVGGVALQTQ